MRILALVMVLLLGGVALAQARCADDLKELQARVDREQKRQPTAQTAAAAKELKKVDENLKQMDEVDCYNAVTRVRRALTAPPPPALKAQQ